MAKDSKPAWADLRLTDRIEPGVRLMLIGINPGVMSATTGHHFAGPTNKFWRLLYESGVVPEPVTHEDDVRLPEWGIGMTNLVARPTPGIDTLRPDEYLEGWRILERKIERFRPEIVAFIGVTMYRVPCRNSKATAEKGRRRALSRSHRVSRSRPFTARASSCCQTRADGTRTSRTATCWPRSARWRGRCESCRRTEVAGK
jgi:TDG/mug DNA glycosylase family protein